MPSKMHFRKGAPRAHFDVEGLCKGLPERVQKVIDAHGDRIKKRPMYNLLNVARPT